MIWIIDASVTIRCFLTEEADSAADSVLREEINKPEMFAVSELFSFEVLSVLGRTHPRGSWVLRDAVLPMISAGILHHPMTDSLALQAAPFLSQGLPAYDACHAALARELRGSWLTYDRKAH